MQDATGDAPIGEIFLLDSAGNPVGGSPTATGQVSSGERITWPVTDGTLTDGSTYKWYMEACDQGVCSAPTATQTFTVNTASAPQPPTGTAMPGAGGTVAVYATANESYTTVDTSSGSSVSISGNGRNDLLFTFTNPGSSPAISGYIDADAAFAPTAASDGQTAFSDVLDGPAIAAANSGAPASLGTDSTGSFTGGTATVTVPASRCFGANPCDQGNAATWAINHDYPGTNKGENGFGDDCTDFVSRALNKDGHFQQYWQGSAILPSTKHNLNYWYQYHYYVGGVLGPYAATSRTWARAISLATFEKHYGAYFYKYEKSQTNVSSNIRVGAVIFAAIAKGSTQWGKIDHTGIVTAVSGRNLYITQHTKNYTNMPLWAAAGQKSWFNNEHGLMGAVWVANPAKQ